MHREAGELRAAIAGYERRVLLECGDGAILDTGTSQLIRPDVFLYACPDCSLETNPQGVG